MLMLLFYAGKDAYAIDSQYIDEVFPQVEIRKIPQTSPPILGYVNVRESSVTAIDLTQLIAGAPSNKVLSTRMVLLSCNSKELVIVVEQAVDVLECREDEIIKADHSISELLFLNGVYKSDRSIQLLDVEKLFDYINQIAPVG